MPSSPTIVTAADQRYVRCLYQMLLSAERHGLAQEHRFVAYDLGIEPAWRDRVARRFPCCEVRRFPFESYPPHVALARRSYAWKPLVIREVALERRGLLLWLDSATLFRSPLQPLWERVRAHRAYVLKGQEAVGRRCDPRTLERLAAPAALLALPERAAGVIGLDCTAPIVERLLSEWCRQALDAALIAPREPPLALHRPEQSLLTVLLYRYQAAGELQLTDDEIDISSSSPIRWLSSRNKVRPGVPLWADAAVRLYYACYKSGDQLLWRLRRARA